MRKFLNRRPGTHYERTDRLNTQWPDHILRTEVTADLITWLGPKTIIDPATGDASIVAAAHKRNPLLGAELGDLSRPNYERWQAMAARGELPAETVCRLQGAEATLATDSHFDVVVLTEFLEHVPDPVAMLRLARDRADWLIASSPLWWKTDADDENPEHLWQFDEAGYEELLIEGGWTPRLVMPVKFIGEIYDFQVWVAR